MDFSALSIAKAVCEASTAVVYAARCSDPSTLRPVGYALLAALAVAVALGASRLGAQR